MSSTVVTPFYFGASQELFGVYHPARTRWPKPRSVLILNPIGQEYMRSFWTLKQLTLQLVNKGFPVLRFDYYGTGDSYGQSREVRLSRCLADITTATRELQTRSGSQRIIYLGLRLGATLALLSQEREGLAEELFLWDPVLDGKDYLGNLLHLQELRLKFRPFERNSQENGDFLLGFPYPQELRSDLASIRPPEFVSTATKIFSSEAEARVNEYASRARESGAPLEVVSLSEPAFWSYPDEIEEALLASRSIQKVIQVLSTQTGVEIGFQGTGLEVRA